MLRIKDLRKSFAGLVAVSGLSFKVEINEAVGLIGPNGSGKTTAINLITGVVHPDSGSIVFKENEMAGLAPHQICQKGIARTFQLVNIFPQMTVLENVSVGKLFGREKLSFKEAEERAFELLEFVELDNYAFQQASSLTYINQKRLELARALATKPDLLLLDEFFAGLTPSELSEGINIIHKVKNLGFSLIVVEHIMSVIVEICDKVVAICAGEKICEGYPSEVLDDKEVIASYLGDAYVKC